MNFVYKFVVLERHINYIKWDFELYKCTQSTLVSYFEFKKKNVLAEMSDF